METIVHADILIIGNKGVPVNSISKEEIKNIFLGNKDKWESGEAITFVNVSVENIHEEFTKNFVKKTPSQYISHFRKLVFTGKGQIPKSFDSEKDLIKFVSETNGAIGYVSKEAGSNIDLIKIIEITE